MDLLKPFDFELTLKLIIRIKNILEKSIILKNCRFGKNILKTRKGRYCWF